MSEWKRESAGRYVRSDGVVIEKDRNARLYDYKWVAYGPADDPDSSVWESTLDAAKAIAEVWWPLATERSDASS